MPLTDTHIRSLKPDVKPRKYFDGGGLFLFVPANGSKLWRMIGPHCPHADAPVRRPRFFRRGRRKNFAISRLNPSSPVLFFF